MSSLPAKPAASISLAPAPKSSIKPSSTSKDEDKGATASTDAPKPLAKAVKTGDAPVSYLTDDVEGNMDTTNLLDDWEELVSAMAGDINSLTHQGYNPATFIKLLANVLNSKGVEAEAGRKYIRQAIALFLTRGNKVKDETKMLDAGRKILAELKKNLNLVVGKGVKMTATTVTPARIVGCFPCETSRLMQSLTGARVVGNRPIGLPKGLCHPAAASVLHDMDLTIWSVWGLWRDSFSDLINQKKDAEKKKEARKESKRFSLITRSSQYIVEEKKNELLAAVFGDHASQHIDSPQEILSALYMAPVGEVQDAIIDALTYTLAIATLSEIDKLGKAGFVYLGESSSNGYYSYLIEQSASKFVPSWIFPSDVEDDASS